MHRFYPELIFMEDMEMRYPEYLQDGGTIGFVAPSFGCAIEPYKSCFDNALVFFEKKGYKTVLGPNCYASEGVGISNTPQLCGKELNEMYASEDSDVIISCGGGELMCEVVPYIDWELIKRSRPKWYIGYSDNTNFTFLSTILADTAAVYGPCAPSFGMEGPAQSLLDALEVIRGKTEVNNYPLWEKESLKDEEHPLVPYNLTEAYCQKLYMPEEGAVREYSIGDGKLSLEGRLVGGCVDCLITLLGTEFDKTADFLERYKEDGFIWFLESCDLNPLSVRRAFFQMKHAGWFKYVKGFLIGRSLHFGEEMMGVDMYNAVTAVIGDLGVPVVMDLDIGHLPPQMPIISGAYAKAEIKENSIRLAFESR